MALGGRAMAGSLAAAGALLLLVGCVLTAHVLSSGGGRTELATAAELAFITDPLRQDGSTKGLEMKNDDGHTKLWNAASSNIAAAEDAGEDRKDPKATRAAISQRSNFYGLPRFFAHSTGWVTDISGNRDRFGLPERKAQPAALAQTQQTTKLFQSPAAGMSLKEKERALQQVKAWETKVLRSTLPDPDAAAAKKAADRVWQDAKKGTLGTKARTQELWNAAENDEITLRNIGHMHPSEMTELQRMSPEFHEIERHAHITSATDMDFHPMAWMHHQGEPGAIASRRTNFGAKLESPARFQQLWNAAENDDIHSGEGAYEGGRGYHPGQWLEAQQDPTELGGAIPREGEKRLFRSDADHIRNYGGSYVNDNNIGIKITNLKARQMQLAQTPMKQAKKTTKLEGEEEGEEEDENAAIKEELDALREKAMSAYGSMPDTCPEYVKAITTGDYEALKAYLDEVATSTTGVPRDSTAKAVPTALKAKDVFASEKKLGKQTVALALIASVNPPLDKALADLKLAKNDEERENIVMDGLALAHTNAIQVMTDPKAAALAAGREEMFVEKEKLALLHLQRMQAMRELEARRAMQMERPVEVVPVMA